MKHQIQKPDLLPSDGCCKPHSKSNQCGCCLVPADQIVARRVDRPSHAGGYNDVSAVSPALFIKIQAHVILIKICPETHHVSRASLRA